MAKIDEVREGMRVFAATGKKVGVVDFVKLADPDAVTEEGQGFGPSVSSIRDLFEDTPDLPQELAERMLAHGYIRVEGSGFHPDRFVGADEIDRVDADNVYLKD